MQLSVPINRFCLSWLFWCALFLVLTEMSYKETIEGLSQPILVQWGKPSTLQASETEFVSRSTWIDGSREVIRVPLTLSWPSRSPIRVRYQVNPENIPEVAAALSPLWPEWEDDSQQVLCATIPPGETTLELLFFVDYDEIDWAQKFQFTLLGAKEAELGEITTLEIELVPKLEELQLRPFVYPSEQEEGKEVTVCVNSTLRLPEDTTMELALLDESENIVPGLDLPQLVLPRNNTYGQAKFSIPDDKTFSGPRNWQVLVIPPSSLGEPSQTGLKILDNDSLGSLVAEASSSVLSEAASEPIVVTVRSEDPLSQEINLVLGFAGTAKRGEDFQVAGEDVHLIRGQPWLRLHPDAPSKFTITARDDHVVEGREVLTLLTSSGPREKGAKLIDIEIVDDDRLQLVLTASRLELEEEGDDQSVTVQAEVRSVAGPVLLSSDLDIPLIAQGAADPERSGRSATLDTDFTIEPQVLHFPKGKPATTTFKLTGLKDNLYEGPESIRLTVSADDAERLAVDCTSPLFTLKDRTPVRGKLLVDGKMSATVSETQSPESTPLKLTFELDPGQKFESEIDLPITLKGVDPSDVKLSKQFFRFSPEISNSEVELSIVDDDLLEGTEIVVLSLSQSGQAVEVTIKDNDAVPLLVNVPANASLLEGVADSKVSIEIVLDRDRISPDYQEKKKLDQEVKITLSDGLVFVDDLVRTVTLSPETPNRSFDVKAKDDSLYRGRHNEQVTLSVSDPTKVRFYPKQVMNIPVVEDEKLSVKLERVGSEKLAEARAGTKVTVRGTLTDPVSEEIAIPLDLAGTAIADKDFRCLQKSLLFKAKTKTAEATFEVLDDPEFEQVETIEVGLSKQWNIDCAPVSIQIESDDKLRLRVTPKTLSVREGAEAKEIEVEATNGMVPPNLNLALQLTPTNLSKWTGQAEDFKLDAITFGFEHGKLVPATLKAIADDELEFSKTGQPSEQIFFRLSPKDPSANIVIPERDDVVTVNIEEEDHPAAKDIVVLLLTEEARSALSQFAVELRSDNPLFCDGILVVGPGSDSTAQCVIWKPGQNDQRIEKMGTFSESSPAGHLLEPVGRIVKLDTDPEANVQIVWFDNGGPQRLNNQAKVGKIPDELTAMAKADRLTFVWYSDLAVGAVLAQRQFFPNVFGDAIGKKATHKQLPR
ncbi:Calx-beta domain-containing protein [Blastopirellula marina]|uniref:Calx-beta domain-containing protein n=1 Tax=Blastopirellula marina TaxID=124 RepID=A0A2S8GNQ5_9BACT|nr:Calx-beta domain-containing protein [Blastopirellula marina]PQO46055.1 hypothetical protein C5Y93_10780 [Blastopirellula marina]